MNRNALWIKDLLIIGALIFFLAKAIFSPWVSVQQIGYLFWFIIIWELWKL